MLRPTDRPRSFAQNLVLVFACVLLLFFCGSGPAVWGQQQPTADAGLLGDRAEAAGQAEETPRRSTQAEVPDVLYVRDKQGNLVPMVDMTLEDFSQLYKFARGLEQPQTTPKFSLQSLKIDGQTAEGRAQLQVCLTVKLLSDEYVRIPLRFGDCVIAEFPQVPEANPSVLVYDDESRDFVFWLKGTSAQTFDLNFQVRKQIRTVGRDSVLELQLPHAARSEFRLRVPQRGILATILERDDSVDVEAVEGGSVLLLEGVQGNVALSWRLPVPKSIPQAGLLEVESELRAKFSSPGAAVVQARFQCRNSDLPLDTVSIRLPRGARLLSESSADDYTVHVASPGPGETRATVLIRFAESQLAPPPIDLLLEVIANPAEITPAIDVADFYVQGAFRHQGTLSLAAEGEWMLRWEDTVLTRVVQEDSLDENADTVASFRYFRQPLSLPVQVLRKRTRLQVNPTAKVEIEPGFASIDLEFTVRVRGAPSSFLQIQAAGWRVVDLDDQAPVRREEILFDETTPLVVPFDRPFTGDLTLRMRGQRSIPEGGEIAMSIPYIVDAVAAPLAVTVTADESMSLSPVDEKMQSFSRESTGSTERQQAYVYRGEPQDATCVFRLAKRDRVATVTSTNTLLLGSQTVEMRSEFRFDVLYQPLEVAEFVLPVTLGADSIRFSLNDTPIDSSQVSWRTENPLPAQPPPSASASDSENGSESSRPTPRGKSLVTVRLPSPRKGVFSVTAVYEPPDLTELYSSIEASPSGVELVIPLLESELPHFEKSRFSLIGREQLDVRSISAQWVVNSSLGSSASFLGDHGSGEVRLLLAKPAANQDNSTTIVERAYVQSWITDQARQDRTAMLIRTATRELRLTLPTDIAWQNLQVLVNGQRSTQFDIVADVLTIPLTGEDKLQQVEVVTSRPRSKNRSRLFANFIRVQGSNWTRQLYWQLVTPSDQLVLAPPDSLISEDRWNLIDCLTTHQGRLDQARLESWARASAQPAPPKTMNQYVFTSLGPPSDVTIRLAPRRGLLVGSSLLALALGAIALLLPRSIQPLVFLAYGCGLGLAAIWFPFQATLIAPLGAIGVLAIAVSRICDWSLSWFATTSPPLVQDQSTQIGRGAIDLTGKNSTVARPLPPVHVTAPE